MSHLLVATGEGGEVLLLALDEATSAMSVLARAPVRGVAGPLAVSADRRFVHVARRSEPFGICTLALDLPGGRLDALGESPQPASLAYISLDRSGRWLLGASYQQHLLTVSAVSALGDVQPPHQVQPTAANAHAVLAAPDNRFVWATCLGGGLLQPWRFDSAAGLLHAHDSGTHHAAAGAGPRHFRFHPQLPLVALLHELDGGLSLLAHDAANGSLRLLHETSTLPAGFSGEPWAADLHFSADGRFLYTSERRGSTLAVFAVDAPGGLLHCLQHMPTATQPRGFAISPGGGWLVAAGQASGELQVHGRDADTGLLRPASSLAVGGAPHWLQMLGTR